MNEQKSHKEEFEELCSGYVLNALDSKERNRFEEMLEHATQEQLDLYSAMKSAAGQIAFSVEQQQAPSAVRQRILEQVKEEEPVQEEGLSGDKESSSVMAEVSAVKTEEDSAGYDRGTFAIAASFALLLVTLSLVFYSFNLSSQLSDREEVIERQQNTITALQSDIERKEELLSILESREVDLVLMAGMEASPNGYGKVIWDSESNRALLQVSNLPAVPSDKDYQLWIIRNNQPVSAGVFAVNDPTRDSFFKIEKIAPNEQTAEAFAITMEPKGGMPQPTGDMYLMGNMKSEN